MPYADLNIGILALQGAFRKHQEAISTKTTLIRYPHELSSCDGLIIGGGESTVIWKQAEEMNLIDALKSFPGPIFGTCAGLIVLQRLGLLDIEIKRNGYGRQIHSFMGTIEWGEERLSMPFIRAPIIQNVGKGVDILATFEQTPVLVRKGRYLGATFHPELTHERRFYDLFFSLHKRDLPLP